MIPPPYLLYLGAAPDELAIKTARGVAHWRPEKCIGEHRLRADAPSLGLGNMAYDVHQYLDGNSSGTSADCVAGAGARLEPFTRWARQHGKRGFLGEFGGGPNEGCTRELAALLEHIAENRDVWLGWTGWAGGPWWGDNYPLSLEPASLDSPRDRPQMAVLRRYFE